MDNLTHTLLALAIARTRIGRSSPLATPALVVAANLPDLDAVTRMFAGPEGYLMYHRGITHALVGIAVQIVFLWALFAGLERWIHGKDSPGRARGGPLLAVAVGLLTHPLLDYLNVYGIRPWLPFRETWHYGDLVFIVDPWLWLLFGTAAVLAGPRRRASDVAYGLLALASMLVIYGVGADRASLLLRVIWAPAVLALAVARWRGIGAARPDRVIGGIAALVTLYLLLLFFARGVAEERGLTAVAAALEPGETIQRFTPMPEVSRPLSWTLLVETERNLYWQPISLLRGAAPWRREPKNLDRPEVLRAAETRGGRAWRTFARYPLADIEARNGEAWVRLTDGRYWFTDWCTISVRADR